jgi:ABC-2 type transport system permease protein
VIVARRFLRDRRRSFLWWSVGVAGMVLVSVAFFPSIEGDPSLDDMVQNIPEAMRTMLGMDEGVSFSSAPGYLQGRLFSTILPVLLLVFAIGVGARAVAGSEDDGTLELLLSNPVSRARVVGERVAAALALTAGLGVITTASVLVLAPLFGALDGVDIAGLLVECAAMTGLALAHGAIALAVGAAVGGRGRALGTAAVVAVGGYLVNGLFALVDALEGARIVSPWNWFLRQNMLLHGPVWWSPVLPLVLAAVVLAVGIPMFLRRDLR